MEWENARQARLHEFTAPWLVSLVNRKEKIVSRTRSTPGRRAGAGRRTKRRRTGVAPSGGGGAHGGAAAGAADGHGEDAEAEAADPEDLEAEDLMDDHAGIDGAADLEAEENCLPVAMAVQAASFVARRSF